MAKLTKAHKAIIAEFGGTEEGFKKALDAMKAAGIDTTKYLPYRDLKSFRGWLQEGRVVREGEKASVWGKMFHRGQTVENTPEEQERRKAAKANAKAPASKDAKASAKAGKRTTKTQAPVKTATRKAEKADAEPIATVQATSKGQWQISWKDGKGRDKSMILNDAEAATSLALQMTLSGKVDSVNLAKLA